MLQPEHHGTKDNRDDIPTGGVVEGWHILMHTPGQELFNGVIHPLAGLFEDYFDVDKAAEEHGALLVERT